MAPNPGDLKATCLSYSISKQRHGEERMSAQRSVGDASSFSRYKTYDEHFTVVCFPFERFYNYSSNIS